MSKKKNKPERPIKSLKDAEQGHTLCPVVLLATFVARVLFFFKYFFLSSLTTWYFTLNRVTSDYIGGDALDELLSKLIRSVEVAKASRAGLPEKIWMKQQFCIGVNDVTRVLERMPATAASHSVCSTEASTRTASRRAPLVPLQAVLVAADCNPKWLTKHIPTLASTRQVPVLCLKDNKGSSLRLGQVANVRIALAIGIKARDSVINKTIDEVLTGSKPVADEEKINTPIPTPIPSPVT